MSLLCRLKNLVHKGLLRKEDLDRIIIVPKGQENEVIKMREATPEERESIAKYINNISTLTGVSFENLEQESCDETVPFDFELYQAGLMDMPKGTIEVLDHIRAEIDQLPTKTLINWDGCCPDIDYPEIEYVNISKNALLSIIDKYKSESEE